MSQCNAEVRCFEDRADSEADPGDISSADIMDRIKELGTEAYYFETFDEIDPVDDFESTDFDPDSLDEYFKGKYSAQYEFLSDHKDQKITVKQTATGFDDFEAEFTIGKYTFRPVSTDVYKK